MSETAAFFVQEVLGFKKSDDGKATAIGFQQPTGEQFSIAIEVGQIWDVVTGLVAAAARPDEPEAGGVKAVVALNTNRFQVETATTGFILRLSLPSGGSVPFLLPPEMAQRLAEVLLSVAGLPATAQAQASGTPS